MSRRRRPARGHAGQGSAAPPPSTGAAVARAPAARDWAFVAVVTASAIVARLLFPVIWAERDSIGSVFYLGDVRAFTGLASALIAGLPFDNGVPFHPPGWGVVLAGIYAISGFDPVNGRPADPATVKAWVAVVSGLACGASTLLTLLVAGRGAAALVGLASVLHFGHMVQGTVPNAEPLYGLLLTLLVTAVVVRGRAPGGDDGVVDRRGVVWWVAIGLLAGGTALVRAEFQLGLALLGGYLLWAQRSVSRPWLVAAAFIAGVVVALTPATVAHWRSIDAFNRTNASRLAAPLQRFAPITSYGAFSFAMANHAYADGGPNSDHPLLVPETAEEEALLDRGDLDLSVGAVHRLYVQGYQLGLGWWLSHPGDAAALVARKVRLTAGAFGLGYGAHDWPAGVDGTRRRVDLFEPDHLWLAPLHVTLLLAGGIWLRRRDPPATVAFAIPLVTLVASTVLFYGYVRLGVAYLPVVWPLQAAAVVALARRLHDFRWLTARPYAAAGVGLLLGLAVMTALATSPRTAALDGVRDARGQLLLDETVRVTGAARR